MCGIELVTRDAKLWRWMGSHDPCWIGFKVRRHRIGASLFSHTSCHPSQASHPLSGSHLALWTPQDTFQAPGPPGPSRIKTQGCWTREREPRRADKRRWRTTQSQRGPTRTRDGTQSRRRPTMRPGRGRGWRIREGNAGEWEGPQRASAGPSCGMFPFFLFIQY